MRKLIESLRYMLVLRYVLTPLYVDKKPYEKTIQNPYQYGCRTIRYHYCNIYVFGFRVATVRTIT